MVSYRELNFTAEPIPDGPLGKRWNLYTKPKGTAGRGALFGTLRALSDMGYTLTSDDNRFRDFAQENLGAWVYARKGDVNEKDILFVCRASYIMFYHKDELTADKLVIDAAFLHGTRQDLEEALYPKQ